MDEIATLLARMGELEPEVYVYGPASEELIAQLETAFGHAMPPSYRAFLARFGAFSIVDSSYSGIIDGRIAQGRGWAWTDTVAARNYCQLPDYYLVIQPDEDGYKCLDFSRIGPDGERPVIYHMPHRRTPFHELDPSYGVWLAGNLRAKVEAWEEEATDSETGDDID